MSPTALRHIVLGTVFIFTVIYVFIDFDLPSRFSVMTTGHMRSAASRQPFQERIVHLDLKGAPPRLPYYIDLFPMLRRLGVTGLLIEYEDMFPYEGLLEGVRRSTAYSKKEIREILELAANSSLEVIPLVQTFGHLEFVLKTPRFSNLSESFIQDNTICISNPRSWDVITEIMRQMRTLHPTSSRIHIGCDEAYHVAEDDLCRIKVEKEYGGDVERLKIAHIARVAEFARSLGFREIFAWNDMFDSTSVEMMMEYRLGSLLTPVVWGYKVDVTVLGYFNQGLFDRLAKVFPQVFFASAFKGANGVEEIFADTDRYLANHESYVKLYRTNASALDGHVPGIFVTGWSRYDHTKPLCELLPTSIPSLVTDLLYLDDVDGERVELRRKVKVFLNCPNVVEQEKITIGDASYTFPREADFSGCTFPGVDVFGQIEELRYLKWLRRYAEYRSQMEETNGTTNVFLEELHKKLPPLKAKLSASLGAIYYPDTVDEFINRYVDVLESGGSQI